MQTQAEILAERIKKERARLHLTQEQLASLCGISLRSLQRIEAAKVVPRAYTLAVLSAHLQVELIRDTELTGDNDLEEVKSFRFNRSQRIIITFGSGILMFLLTAAFLSQSASFPETTFELAVFVAGIFTSFILLLVWIWRTPFQANTVFKR